MDDKSFGKVLLNKVTETLSYAINIDRKVNNLHNEHIKLMQELQGFYKTNLRSQIPYMTPKQLHSLESRGWTVEELSNISGYTVEDIVKKINNYRNA